MPAAEHVHVAAVREMLWHFELERMRAIIRYAVLQGTPIKQIADEMGVTAGAVRTFLRGRHLYAEDDEPFRRWCEGMPEPGVHGEQAALAVLAMDYPQSFRAQVRATITMWMRSLYVERGDRVPAWIVDELHSWAKLRPGLVAGAAGHDFTVPGTVLAAKRASAKVGHARRSMRRSDPGRLFSLGGALGSGL
ncbi:sigma-70 region 4 domain-containing protein [Longimicrobium terrae]|uniref:Uncharacterized protein n=1 Tax=Longimicrobium terrae TaxID=1639882 RepID=A0A841H1N0_9BACT|nr:sigma-70 region 4 domain-containing protein [Longimicrobium terrae]MBB4637480.1 hypothetical protein [Longimicrobium terrae]MBB6071878.1 hypothetical protein [Longimicrobium terrae]NNC30426.1 sigma-70 region 4 domain-containing protein [Longimicrobium terrae]